MSLFKIRLSGWVLALSLCLRFLPLGNHGHWLVTAWMGSWFLKSARSASRGEWAWLPPSSTAPAVPVHVSLLHACSPMPFNCRFFCWLRDLCVLSFVSPSLVKICLCGAHQVGDGGMESPSFWSRWGSFTGCPCGLRQAHLTSLCLSFSTRQDIPTYLTGVLWGLINVGTVLWKCEVAL